MGFQEAYRAGVLEIFCSGYGKLEEELSVPAHRFHA